MVTPVGVNHLISSRNRSAQVADIRIHFGDVAARCEEFIRGSRQIVGAVAWARNPKLMAALAKRPVSLIVNKEFALRKKGSKERVALAQLRGGVSGFPQPARCVGDCSRGLFTGLMHHKFLVRLDRDMPTAVWTGSFNLTTGAAGNFENAVEIHDPLVAVEFFVEFARLYEISEPLDFRQGTPAQRKTRSETSSKTRTSGKRPTNRKSSSAVRDRSA